MKNRKLHRTSLILVYLIFGIFAGLALGANWIGLDKGSASWGLYRKGLFGVGAGGLLLTFLFGVAEKIEKTWRPKSEIISQETHRKDPPAKTAFKTRKIVSVIAVLLAVEILYVGFISVWNWVDWPKSTNLYGMLGQAFLEGKANLPIEPSPLLADLQNPYPSAARAGIPVETDLSYFNHKYYMYWGPAPAVGAALAILLTGQIPGDEQIIFISISAAFLFSFLILQNLRRRFFSSIPGWLSGLGIFSVAASFPFLWVLNSPDIYGAAIAAGQAFLLGGLFFALPILGGGSAPRWRLLLAGAFWILAIGSRLILAVPVAVLLLGILIQWILQARKTGNWAKTIPTLIFLGLPMLMGLILLGFYNYVRFGDFFETGLRYSLNPHDLWTNIPKGWVFNPRYLFSDLFYYFLTPIRVVARFPFLKPYWGPVDRFARLLEPLGIPSIYTIDNSVGLLFTTPTLLFAAYLLQPLFKGRSVRIQNRDAAPENGMNEVFNFEARFTLGFILLAGIAASLPILTYFYVSCRYLLDFVPLLNIPIVVGIWQFYRAYKPYPIRRWLAIVLIVSLAVFSAGTSFMLALTGAQTRFDDFNPALFNALLEFFR